jgi:hypothetical protein
MTEALLKLTQGFHIHLLATKEFEDIIEDLGDYEGAGLVTGEMLDYLEQCHHQRLRKKVATLPTP